MDLLDAHFSSQNLLALAKHFQGEAGTALLFSGSSYETAETSFLCLYPYEKVIIEGDSLTRLTPDGEVETFLHGGKPWEALKQFLSIGKENDPYPEWVGYFGYEMGLFSDGGKRVPYHSPGYPDACFLRSSVVFIHELKTQKLKVKVSGKRVPFMAKRQRELLDLIANPALWHAFLQKLKQAPKTIFEASESVVVQPLETLESYVEKVHQAKKMIFSGDIYQVNLSQKIVLKSEANPFNLFCRLNSLNPAPFSAYLSIAPNHAIVSSSPERLLQLKEGYLETRPIKGTAPRSDAPFQDEKNKEDLLSSEKERAELLMITDLMRNDLSKVSLPGTVQTKSIWALESYNNVHHMLSIISSQAKPGLAALDLVRACFPGGSITGCPKLRAMEVIHQLEREPRGIYTGSIGYFAGNGDFDFNIAIRTMNIFSDLVTIRLGGGIVADSNPQKEHEETLHKGKSMLHCFR